ncbi:sugar-binding transcriptional regulator [Ectobacillus panaciterrae]|uniref:sugar-binding transcriptional regulator n=1 Tax=Ectobacillus panaciterrae TaxID=363872 RepID=UPI00040CCA8C|nr:sugar-binding domain-containing protein [Ectobacillus panaciterrae]
MRAWIDYAKKLLPDLLPVMQIRMQILQYIRLTQPIGRRNLSTSLNMTERVLRSEVQVLKEQNLIHVASAGMTLTDEGTSLVIALEEFMREISGLKLLEEKLKEALNLDEVFVVAGDSDESPWVKQEMGRASVACIKERLGANNIVAVTGGTTLAAVADMMQLDFKNLNPLFVPARGGIGESVENEANTICAKMAKNTNSSYRLLYVPDHVGSEVYASIMTEPSVKSILELIQSSNIVIHGIGDALTMARRRKTPETDWNKIVEGHAVGEAFGYYFNETGEVVHKVLTVGMQLEDLQHVRHVMAVAGGSSKAKAIQAVVRQGHTSLLVTDEGAAKELLRVNP